MKVICVLGLIICCGFDIALGAANWCTYVDVPITTKYTCILSNADAQSGESSFTGSPSRPDTDVLRVQSPTTASHYIILPLINKFTALQDLEIPFAAKIPAGTVLSASVLFGSSTTPLPLKKLQIKNSDISTWSPKTFERLAALTDLDLSNNKISTFDTEAFFGLGELLTLNLADNSILSFPVVTPLAPPLATPLAKLRVFNVSGNQITAMPTSLPSATVLETIDFSRNTISTIPTDYFKTCTKLKELSLRQNKLTSLDANSFEGTTELKLLDLGSNQFTSFEFLKKASKIETLNLNDTGITQFTDDFFSGNLMLTQLYAANNKLITINTSPFTKLALKLVLIDVSNNRINHVDQDFFGSLTALTKINFACNRCISQHSLSRPTDISAQFEVCKSSSIILSTALILLSAVISKFI